MKPLFQADGDAPGPGGSAGARRALPIGAALLALLLLWLVFGWQPQDRDRALQTPALPRGGDFVLESAAGPVALADFRGRVVLLYFGYTACPDICPTSLAILAAALRGLDADERARVRVLFVSVDPARDDPAHLREYAGYFHPEIIGLTGTAATLAELARRYGVAYRRTEAADSALGYLIDHSALVYLIDPDGHLREQLPHGLPADQIIARVRRLLPPEAGSESRRTHLEPTQQEPNG